MKKLITIIFLFCTPLLFSQRISELPAASSPGIGDLFAIVQSGVTKKITFDAILTFVASNNSYIDSIFFSLTRDSVFFHYTTGEIDTVIIPPKHWNLSGDDIENINEGMVTIGDTANLNGEVFMPNLGTEIKVAKVTGWFVSEGAKKGKLFPISIISLYNQTQDSINKLVEEGNPPVNSTWRRDTNNNFVVLADTTDFVGIGTTTPTYSLDVRGNLASEGYLYVNPIGSTDPRFAIDAVGLTGPYNTKYMAAYDSVYLKGPVRIDSVTEHGDWIKTDYITGSGLDEYGEPMNENNIMLGNGAFVKDARAGDTAIYSIFHGYHAGYDADTIFTSDFIGCQAGEGATKINNSTYLGYAGSGSSNVSYSVFIGSAAGEESSNIISSYFIGSNAGQTATNDTNCFFIGNVSGNNSDNNKDSFFIGDNSGTLSDGVKNSLFIGAYTGVGSSDIENSIFIGDSAGYGQTTISNELWIDNTSTSTPLIWGDFATDSLRVNGNFAITKNIYLPTTTSTVGQLKQNGETIFHTYGLASLFLGIGAGNLATANGICIGIGDSVLTSSTATYRNYAVGYMSQQSNQASDNCSFGYQTLKTNSFGDWNNAFGNGVLVLNTTGHHNNVMGGDAFGKNTTGYHNVGLGDNAGFNNTEGFNNVFIGSHSGAGNTTGSENVFIGYNAGAQNTTGSNKLYIENSNSATPLIYGDFSTDRIKINGSFSSGVGTVADNDATPDVTGANTFIYTGTANSVAVTDLDNPTPGEYYTFIGNSDTYTLNFPGSTNFKMTGTGVNLGQYDVLVFYCQADNLYILISYSNNTP